MLFRSVNVCVLKVCVCESVCMSVHVQNCVSMEFQCVCMRVLYESVWSRPKPQVDRPKCVCLCACVYVCVDPVQDLAGACQVREGPEAETE